ncbi:MAG: glucose-6-phosphate dehydrogenase [Acidobacteriaceae bacterium]|nr:glucose-6-phosphate dehydrogenase [Acidobacteriaceae bacterium]
MPHDKASGTKPAGPCSMVIFGAGGDLTKRLVVPALYNLACGHLLPEAFAITGVDLAQLTAEAWHESLAGMTKEFIKASSRPEPFNQDVWNWLTSRMSYVQGDLNNPALYDQLKKHLADLDQSRGTQGNYLFYLAIADRFFGAVVEHLGESELGCEKEGYWRRVVIEKPFGHDLASAQALNKQILNVLPEKQIYRIDHFLGKETVQNLMMFRFANGIFEPIWNRDRIDHVQITVAETVGVEKRGHFYEHAGALRDMIPNHGFQLIAMTAMEAPNSFGADAIRTEKAKVLEAIHLCTPDQARNSAVRGQYGPGEVDGKPVPGYREEPDVAPDSPIETYAALKVSIDNWRWSGVPFYIRTGKRLSRRKTVIAICFKEVPGVLLRNTPIEHPAPNWLLIRVQPDEGIAFEFGAKIPGPAMKLGEVRMDFKYEDYFGTAPSTGYETLIYDVMIGDATLFQRADSIELAWGVVQPVLDVWGSERPANFPNYAAGTAGPSCADDLLKRDGRAWREIR